MLIQYTADERARPAARGQSSARRPVRRPIRIVAGRLDRPLESVAGATVPTAAVGSMLAGADAVARVATRPLLGGAACGEPQGHALGCGFVRAGGVPIAGTGERVAFAP